MIGAGAAGLMAAGEAASRGARVRLLEKNSKTGVKILMSGGTRCNLTHDTDARGITRQFGHADRFLQPSVGAFPPSAVVESFERWGVATKREDTGKIFPVSNRAVQVRDALQRFAVQAGAEVLLRTAVRGFRHDEAARRWQVLVQRDGKQETLSADRLIVTAGGTSWPGCGTTGDAYQWLAEFGHTIVPPRPALVPLVGGNEATRQLSGLTLPDVNATATLPTATGKGKAASRSRRSSLLFTHFGFSGPAAMDVSGLITLASDIRDTQFKIDFIPDLTSTDLDSSFQQAARSRGKAMAQSWLSEWLPARLADVLSVEAGATEAARPIAEWTKRGRRRLIDRLKQWQLPISDTRGFGKAEVTAGGVSLAEVDRKTMASRKHDGLFIAGEVLDVDGPIGGYNFQAAFSTGRAAGIAASAPLPDPD